MTTFYDKITNTYIYQTLLFTVIIKSADGHQLCNNVLCLYLMMTVLYQLTEYIIKIAEILMPCKTERSIFKTKE